MNNFDKDLSDSLVTRAEAHKVAVRFGLDKPKAKQYARFVGAHSNDDGVYGVESALRTFLCNASEPRILLLRSLASDDTPLSLHEVFDRFCTILDDHHFPRNSITSYNGLTKFLREHDDNDGRRNYDSWLVRGGLVDKLTKASDNDNVSVYVNSAVCSDVLLPLTNGSVAFVNEAIESGVGHSYDSIGRIMLRNADALITYHVVKEIFKARKLDLPTLTHAVQAASPGIKARNIYNRVIYLGSIGLINYATSAMLPDSEFNVAVRYNISSPEQLLRSREEIGEAIKRRHEKFVPNKYFHLAIDWIIANQHSTYKIIDLAELYMERCGIHSERSARMEAGRMLFLLSEVGLLNIEGGFGRTTHSRIEANELTDKFYTMVLLPSATAASTLSMDCTPRFPNPSNTAVTRLIHNYIAENGPIRDKIRATINTRHKTS